MRYALIGCGRISPNHIAAALANKLEIVGLCDLDESRIEDKVLKYNLDRKKIAYYKDYLTLLMEQKPELVSICTESGSHAAIALECISMGVNIIVEKPIALSLEDADTIIKAAKKNGVKVCACHQNRFNKSVLKIREAIDQGRFGKLFYGTAHIRWNRAETYYKSALWRGTWEMDGGALMNQCIHNIDLLRWMLGSEISEVFAYTDNLNHSYIEAEDLGIALIKFKNGAYGILEGTTNIYPRNLEETLYLFGEKGTVKAGGSSVNIIEEWHFADLFDDAEEVKKTFHENPPNIYGFGHTPLFADVILAIKKDRQPKVTAEDGKRALELVLAIYKSADEGQPIKLPLERGATTDYKGRF